MKKLKNGEVLRDTDGNIIHAHGGWILQNDEGFFWYGENREGECYVNCYFSKDLTNWEFRNSILTTKSESVSTRVNADLKLINEDGTKVNIERPKVLYNEKTKKYVMWAHYENGKDYSCAAACIATCDRPDGDFVYHGSFRPYGEMSRDCTVYEEAGKAYFLSASRDNADMHIYRLQDDYLNVEELVNKCWSNEYREAPAIMKKEDKYYCFSSFCTGWDPNQCKYAISNSLEVGFGYLTEIGDETTYKSQPAFILQIDGNSGSSYLYVGDRWCREDYSDSRYVWFPIEFDENGQARLINCEEVEIDLTEGKVIY